MAVPADELERRRQMLEESIAQERAAKAGAAASGPVRTQLMAQAPASVSEPEQADSPKATALMPAAQILAAARHEELSQAEAATAGTERTEPVKTALLAQIEPGVTQPVQSVARADVEQAAAPKATLLMAQAPSVPAAPKATARPASEPQVRKTMMMGSLEAQLKAPSAADGLDEWPDPSGWDLGGGVGSLDDVLPSGPSPESAPATGEEQPTAPLTDLGHAETAELDEWDPMGAGDAPASPASSPPQHDVEADASKPAEPDVGDEPEAASGPDPHRPRKTVPAGVATDAAASGVQLGQQRAGRSAEKRQAKGKRRGLPTANVRRHEQDVAPAKAAGNPSLLKWLLGVAVVVVLVAILLGVALLIILQ